MVDCYCNSWNTLGEMSPQHVGVTNHYRCTGWVMSCCNKLYDMLQLHIALCVLENFCGNLCLSNVILSLWQVVQILSDLILCNLLQWPNSVAETYTHILYCLLMDVVLFFFLFFVFFKNTQRVRMIAEWSINPPVFLFFITRAWQTSKRKYRVCEQANTHKAMCRCNMLLQDVTWCVLTFKILLTCGLNFSLVRNL